jgi:transmembrane sensor
MAEVWDAFDALEELAETFPLLQRGDQRPKAPVALKLAACAALALLAVGVSATLYLLWGRAGNPVGKPVVVAQQQVVAPRRETPPAAVGAVEPSVHNYRTTVGSQLSVPLADGSVLTLNTDTSLDVAYTASLRLIVLKKGEANFNVARDPSRPFQVQIGTRLVQAVGTEFNVKLGSLKEDVRVTVSEGTVKVLDPQAPQSRHKSAAAHTELLVRAGEEATIGDGGERVRRIEVSQIEASNAWQRGMLVYKGETLDTVIADVSRYTTVRFSISDESIRSKRVGGVFRTGDVDGLLVALRESFGIDARREGNVIVLTAKR